MYPLTIVIPAFNEHDRLPPTLSEIFQFMITAGSWLPTEVVVVDDGSRDDTARAAAAVSVPPEIAVTIHRHEQNRGKGAAVRTGFQRSSAFPGPGPG